MNQTSQQLSAPLHSADPDAQRTAVIRAARQLLDEGGVAQLSARRLAAALGVSTKIVYSRFGGMGGVVDALYADAFEALAAAMAEARAGQPARERLPAMARAYRRYLLDHPALFTLMFESPARDTAARERDRAAAAPALLLYARAYLETGQGSDAARQSAYALWAATHGAVALEASAWLKGEGVFERVLTAALRA